MVEIFRFPVRVYWEDTDAGGVVYHASYVRFLERARTEYFRALGIEQGRLCAADAIVFVVRDVALRFIKPAVLDDLLHATVVLRLRRAASLAFDQRVERAADGVVLVEARVRTACVDADDFRPRPIPDRLLHLIPETRNP